MCLAIPAKVAALEEGNLATVDILGVTREISVDLTPQAQVDRKSTRLNSSHRT